MRRPSGVVAVVAVAIGIVGCTPRASSLVDAAAESRDAAEIGVVDASLRVDAMSGAAVDDTRADAASVIAIASDAASAKPRARRDGESCDPGRTFDGQGNCERGARCCAEYAGGCGGARPGPTDPPRPPCTMTMRCMRRSDCPGTPP